VMRRRAGRRAAALLRRLQRQQLSLAMLRTRLPDDHDPDLVDQRQRIIRTPPGAARGHEVSEGAACGLITAALVVASTVLVRLAVLADGRLATEELMQPMQLICCSAHPQGRACTPVS
jgi:hypothetical protein